jgi:hypothetical protein
VILTRIFRTQNRAILEVAPVADGPVPGSKVIADIDRILASFPELFALLLLGNSGCTDCFRDIAGKHMGADGDLRIAVLHFKRESTVIVRRNNNANYFCGHKSSDQSYSKRIGMETNRGNMINYNIFALIKLSWYRKDTPFSQAHIAASADV